jgi:NTE family protein
MRIASEGLLLGGPAALVPPPGEPRLWRRALLDAGRVLRRGPTPAPLPAPGAAATGTAFVLSGGGNRGAIQVGMLRALARAGIRPDLVVGASVGAINGAGLAADPTQEGVEALARTWLALRDDQLFPRHQYGGWRFIQHRNSVYPDTGLRRAIESFLPYVRLEDAVVPIEVVAASLTTGSEVWFTEGPAVDALLASAALPGVFPPVQIGSDLLIDGGVLNDVPISRACRPGISRVYVLLCGPLISEPVPAGRPVEALLAAFAVAVRGRYRREIEAVPAGVEMVVIGADAPQLQGYWDFSRTAELIDIGEASAEEVLAALAERAA